MTMLRSLFGIGTKTDLAHILASGALVLDVRTPEEFREGHVPHALNIPLDRLENEFGQLDKLRPIVTCCRSGIRSATAVSILNRNGFMAHNGGSWTNVGKHLSAR